MAGHSETMIFTVLCVFVPLMIVLSGLRHWAYGIHVAILVSASWIHFPSLQYDLWHPYYVYYLGGVHLLSITLVTFAAYGWDKRQAKWGGWRIPEKTLHALAFIGGTLGAYAGSKLFRHKTIKGQFRQMFWLVTMVQLVAILVVLWLK